jgi:pilus assembly protein CpaB
MPNLTKIAAGALIVVAALLGIFAWTLARRPAQTPVVVTPAAQATYPVVVTMRDLPAGKPITADALRVQSLPINPNGAFTDPSLLVGRVPNANLGAQTPVLESQLSSGIAERIEPGERAVAVRVEEGNAVGNRLRPGNFVDVFFTLKRDGTMGSGEIDQSQARLLMSKVRILAFGNATAGNDTTGDPNGMVRTAVLAVPVADVDRLTLAETSGRLVFALRNPRDAEVVDENAFAAMPAALKVAERAGSADSLKGSTLAAEGVTLDGLSGNTGAAGKTRPVAAPRLGLPAVRTAGNLSSGIEVIRGGRTETVAQ